MKIIIICIWVVAWLLVPPLFAQEPVRSGNVYIDLQTHQIFYPSGPFAVFDPRTRTIIPVCPTPGPGSGGPRELETPIIIPEGNYLLNTNQGPAGRQVRP